MLGQEGQRALPRLILNETVELKLPREFYWAIRAGAVGGATSRVQNSSATSTQCQPRKAEHGLGPVEL